MKTFPSTSNHCRPKISWTYLVVLYLLQGLFSSLYAQELQLVDARWMTDGQDPTYLNLYPMSGRSASSQIFVQVDLSGASAMIEDQVGIVLENPVLLPGAFQASADVEVIKGNGGAATVLGVIDVDNDINWPLATAESVLKLKLYTVDDSGTEAMFDLGDVCLYLPDPDGPFPDLEPPEIVEAIINEGNPISLPEDLEEDEFEFTSTVRLTDVWKGIEEANLFYRHEDGGFFNGLSIDVEVDDLTSGTLNDGVYTVTSTAAKFIRSGTYELFAYSVADKSGNEFGNFGSDAPEGVQKTIEVVNPNEDLIPPELTSPVVVTPTSGDVTTDPLLLTFSFSAKDEGTGINFGSVRVFHSTDEEVTSRSSFISSGNLVSGDEFMGSYEVPVEIPVGQTAGDYFYQIRLSDGAFQSVTYGPMRPGSSLTPEPLPEGSTEKITITGTSSMDTTPPVLDSIAVAFDDDLAAGPGVMEVTMMISEPESELGFFGNRIRFIGPTGATDISRSFGSFNLDPETGAYKVDINLDKAIETGTYCFAVHLENTDDVEVDYGLNYDYLPFPGDFSGTWEIDHEGPVDYTPPIPVEFTVLPGVVDTGTDVTLNVALRIIDEGTGVQFESDFSQPITLDLLNGLPGEFGFRQSIFSTQLEDPATDARGVGTVNDVTYTFEIPLTGDQFGGDFLSFRLNLMDCAGNSRIYDSSICNFRGNSPFPFDEAQITTNGNEDPIIISDGGGATAAVSADENQTAVTTVKAIDAPGEILTYSISGGADSALFDLNANSGVLTFKTPPSFASPSDSGADGVYEVTVEVSDGNGGMVSQAISVTVINVDTTPMISSNGGGPSANISVEEGQTTVTTVTATDTSVPADTLTFSITGGADQALFEIDASSGDLTFASAPVFATPTDADTNNVYEVTVQVSDNNDGTDSQEISVTVTQEVIDEDDYEAYANGPQSPFPAGATAQDKAFDNDYDKDGKTNGEEFAAGTNPAEANDVFWAMIEYSAQGPMVLFSPYTPDTNEYTLFQAFQGANNDERVALNATAQAAQGEEGVGMFTVAPSGGLENVQLFVGTEKTSL